MRKKKPNDLEELPTRTESDSDKTLRRAAQKIPQPAASEPAARRVYNGDPQSATPGYAVRPENRKMLRKKRPSTFNIVTALFLVAVGIVVYIGNIITVNQLVVEVHQLQMQYDRIANQNSVLKAEINRKSGWENIGNTAKNTLGLIYSPKRAQAFDVDGAKLDKFKDK